MVGSKGEAEKVFWSGRVVAVQPRIRLMRSFDERSHSYQGYVLRIDGTIADEPGEFMIAIGKAAQAKHRFQAGMEEVVRLFPSLTRGLRPPDFSRQAVLRY